VVVFDGFMTNCCEGLTNTPGCPLGITNCSP